MHSDHDRPTLRNQGKALLITNLICALLLPIVLGAGCATRNETSSPKPGSGIAEYAQLAKQALKDVNQSLAALDRFAGSTGTNEALARFSQSLQQLQVNSQTVRAHAQAMEARGDAYFEHWEANLARVKDARFRQLAEEHHQDLQQSFQKIKGLSQDARAAFKSYIAGLRGIRVAVEKDPSSFNAQSTTELIKATREHGQHVEKQLQSILAELDGMAAMLKVKT
jgi:DNA repair ATPase RecN